MLLSPRPPRDTWEIPFCEATRSQEMVDAVFLLLLLWSCLEQSAYVAVSSLKHGLCFVLFTFLFHFK